MINSVLKNMTLSDIDTFLSNTKMEIHGAGRYFHIKNKEGKNGGLVSARALASRINKLAKGASVDKQLVDNVVDKFIAKNTEGYKNLYAKMKSAKGLQKATMKISRFINKLKDSLPLENFNPPTKNIDYLLTKEKFEEFQRKPVEEEERILDEKMEISDHPKADTVTKVDFDPFTEEGFKEFLSKPGDERGRILYEKTKQIQSEEKGKRVKEGERLAEKMEVSSKPKADTEKKVDFDIFSEEGFKIFLNKPVDERGRLLWEKMQQMGKQREAKEKL